MIITKRSGKLNVITKEFGLLGNFERYFDIAKIDEEKRIVEGIMTKATIDNQEEIVDWEGTKEAFKDFIKFGNVREMHRSDSAAGTVVDYNIDDDNKLIKVWAKIVDDGAWKKVKEGVYKGFSIGGKALKRVKEFIPELGKVVSIVKKYVLNELSLVDKPAHPDCLFTIVKRDGNYNDPLMNEVASTERKLDTFKGKILTDDQISKLKDFQFGLIKKYRKGLNIIKCRHFAMPDKVHAQAVLNVLDNSDLSKRDKFVVHDKAASILGKRHNGNKCQFCRIIQKFQEGTILRKRRDKLAQAAQLLSEIREDNEAMSPGPDEVESEDLRPARQREDFDEKMRPEFTGAEAGEGEYEEPYPYEVEDDGEDDEGWDGYTGYEEGMPEETERTHTIDPEEYYDERSRALDSEDQEGYDPRYAIDDEEEDDEAGDACPYCGTTIKLAMKSGTMRKGSTIECPGCGTIYGVKGREHVSVEPINRVSKRSRGPSEGDEELEVLVGELAKRDEMIDRLCDQVEKFMQRPNPRKGNISRGIRISKSQEEEADEEEEISKRDQEIDDNMKKAEQLRKMVRETGKPLSPEDEMFCKQALDSSLEKRFG